MASFQPAVTLQQSADGKTIVVTDVSNYSSNSDGVLLSNIVLRTDTIIDGLGNPIQMITFGAGLLTDSFPLVADAYLNNSLSFTLADSSVRTGTDNFLADNYYNNAAREVSRQLRCCNCTNLCNAAVKADLSHSEAVTATLFGVPSEAQNAINDANSLINSEDCNC